MTFKERESIRSVQGSIDVGLTCLPFTGSSQVYHLFVRSGGQIFRGIDWRPFPARGITILNILTTISRTL